MSFFQAKPNYLYSIICVSLILFLLGFLGIVFLYTQQLFTFFKEKVSIVVELQDNMTFDDIQKLKKTLEKKPYTIEKTIAFISKEEALNIMKSELGDEFEKMDISNPLVDVLTFNVSAENLSSAQLEQIKSEIKQNNLVSDVYYEQSVVNDLSKNLNHIIYVALFLGSLFLLIAYVLIHNTVKLALYSNRMLIKNMELVGASWNFISKPYLIRALKNGLWSAIFAIIFLTLLIFWVQQEFPDMSFLHSSFGYILLFGILTLLSVIITVSSTYIVIHKYLKMRIDDLI